MQKKCSDLLKKLTGKKHIFFTNRGNTSIKLALKLAKELGKEKAFIQDQGGWITYEQYLKQLKYDYYLLDTDSGLVDTKLLEQKLDKDSVLLTNSMPGYFAVQDDMKKIDDLCRKKHCFLINDASGSIGRDIANCGDMIIGSFGRWKPLNIEYGGFIAFDDKHYEDFFKKNMDKELEDFYPKLYEKLKNLKKRLKKFQELNKKVKKDLKGYDIIHKDAEGINVIVRFSGPIEEMNIIDYCKLYGYEYTLCPRYIRVMEPAISIELKRIEV